MIHVEILHATRLMGLMATQKRTSSWSGGLSNRVWSIRRRQQWAMQAAAIGRRVGRGWADAEKMAAGVEIHLSRFFLAIDGCGGGSSGSPRCVWIFRIGPGSVMNAISRMSPPQFGHSSGNSSPTLAMSLAQAIRDVSCERGF